MIHLIDASRLEPHVEEEKMPRHYIRRGDGVEQCICQDTPLNAHSSRSSAFYERKDNFKETSLFKQGVQGASLHSLIHLLQALPHLQRDIKLDRTEKLKKAWNTITRLWQKDELRYWDKMGDEGDSKQLLEAVKVIHRYILNQQGEAV